MTNKREQLGQSRTQIKSTKKTNKNEQLGQAHKQMKQKRESYIEA